MQSTIIDPHYIIHFIKKRLNNMNIDYDNHILTNIVTPIKSNKAVQLLYFGHNISSNFKTNIYEYNINVKCNNNNIKFNEISTVMIDYLDICITDIYSLFEYDDDTIILDCNKNIIHFDNINVKECNISIYRPTLLILSNCNIDDIKVKYVAFKNDITSDELNIFYFELMIIMFLMFYLLKLASKEDKKTNEIG